MADNRIYVKDGLRKIVQGEQLIISVGVDHNSFTNDGTDHNLHYLWTRDGIPFGTEEGDLAYHDYQRPREFWDRPILVLDDILPEDSGIYQCEISNAFGTVQSEPQTVEVLDALNTPLLTRNLVQNGEMRDGDAGWNIIEGSMEQIEPYFWDKYKGIGFASTDNMTPKSGKIMNEEEYPPPANGDRLLAQWANRAGENEIKIQQDIDLTGIADVIDRQIEGITSVDLKVAAWLSSKRFHPQYSEGYTKEKEGGGIHYGRATTDGATNEWKDWPMNSFFYKRCCMFDDRLHIDFQLFDERGDLLRTIRLHNVPTSYRNSLTAFKQRRIELPVGTRRIRIELIGRRENDRPLDKRLRNSKTDMVKMIAVGAWGINARIYVNDIGDTFNSQYRTWDMPHPAKIHPAPLSYEQEYHQNFKNRIKRFWEQQADGEGITSDISFKLASWMGYPTTSYRWSANSNTHEGAIRMNWKWFDIWRNVADDVALSDGAWQSTEHYDTDLEGYDRTSETDHHHSNTKVLDWWFGTPVNIHDAAKAHLNVKKMNVHWLKDYNLMEMDKQGKSFMVFQFNSPTLERDQESLDSIVTKRRKLVVPSSGLAPLVYQRVYLEDIDKIILDVHANTSQFKIILNQLETKTGAWSYDGYWNLSDEIYDFVNHIHESGLTQLTHIEHYQTNWAQADGSHNTWEELISRPRTTEHLELYHSAMRTYIWYLLNVPHGSQPILTSDSEIIDMRGHLTSKLKIDTVWDKLKIYLGIPEESLIHREDELKIWVKKRLASHLMDTFFRSIQKRLEKAYKDDFYKDAIDGNKTRDKLPVASDNLWTDGDP